MFLPETVRVSPIQEADQYGGERVTFEGRLGKVKLPLRVDVGIGDAVYPPPEWLEYPSLLNVPRPVLRAYQPETSIAEKVHAMVDRGETNSRMKDYFDIAELARIRVFDGSALSRALRETFERRGTPVPASPKGLSIAFGRDPEKQRQWEGFVTRNRVSATRGFEVSVMSVARFVQPVLIAVSRGESLIRSWPAGGPSWIPEGE